MSQSLNKTHVWAILVLLLAIIGPFSFSAQAQSGRTFYIDYSAGSNSFDGTEKTHTTGVTGPWKTAPPMFHSSSCDSSTGPTYAHQAGDHFIFKGGVSWPAVCFAMIISSGGSSASTVNGYNQAPTINGADYYGVDVTWFTGGSFTRPLFDMGGSYVSTGAAAAVIQTSGTPSNITVDDIEIAHQLGLNTCGGASMDFNGASGITIDRMYIHDWSVAGGISNSTVDHFNGSVCGGNSSSNFSMNVYNTEVSDAAQPAGQQTGSCFIYVNEVGWDNCHNTAEGALFTAGPFHDTQMHDLDGILVEGTYTLSTHMNGYESDFAGHPSAFYNNYEYNMNVGFNALCPGTATYNNVFSKIYNSGSPGGTYQLVIDTDCSGATDSNQSFVYNNTFDPSGPGGGGGFQVKTRTSGQCPGGVCHSGAVTFKNNIYINTANDFSGMINNVPTISNNYPMPTAEANTFGFTPANKYKPSLTDSNTSGVGANLTSQCSGALAALCQDASGAPWFGSTYVNRPTAEDLGAFQGNNGGGGTGPPTVSVSSPAAGNQTGTVTFTLTATPQGSATITSCKLTIDGYNFGAAVTSSPYQLSWDTTTASNQAHSLSAVSNPSSCTDSNGQTGSATNIVVTPNNSLPNAFVSNANFSTFLTFTPQTTGTQTYTFTVTPNTAGNAGDTAQDSVIGLSQAQAASYGQMATILRANTNNVWDAYDGSVPGYHALNNAPYTPGTAYTFSMTPNLSVSPCTYSLSETSPSNIVIATNFQCRTAVTSLGFINANSANDSTPDTVKVSNFTIGSSPVLSYNPGPLNFGNVTDSTTAMLTDSVTISSGPATITSVAVAGTGFSGPDVSSTCPSSGSLSSACTYVVDFDPPSTGCYTGTLTVTSNATGSPQVINLTGCGVASSPATVTLSTNVSNPVNSINLNSTRIHTPGATVTVTGTVVNGPATISVSLTGGNSADFKIVSDGCTGSISTTCQEVFQYTPHMFGSESTTAAFAISGQTTQNVTLVGNSVVSTQVIAVPF